MKRKYITKGRAKRFDVTLDSLSVESLDAMSDYFAEINFPVSYSVIIRKALKDFCANHFAEYDALPKDELNTYNSNLIRAAKTAAGR